MRPRCVELARVLKKTGSFYYHCDWHASHYVKVMLDQIFGENQFVNEIIWKRQSAHSDAKQGAKHFGRVHDTHLLLREGRRVHLESPVQAATTRSTSKHFYRHVEPETGGGIAWAISRRRAVPHRRRAIRITSSSASRGTGVTAKRT